MQISSKLNKQAVVRGTINPAPCCHLANATDLFPLSYMAGHHKLTFFGPPTCLPELTQNVIRSSHGHSTPSPKISRKSVQPFSRNVADKERKKSPENNTQSPYRGRGPPTGGGVKNNCMSADRPGR